MSEFWTVVVVSGSAAFIVSLLITLIGRRR
jgi:hypothetical protein